MSELSVVEDDEVAVVASNGGVEVETSVCGELVASVDGVEVEFVESVAGVDVEVSIEGVEVPVSDEVVVDVLLELLDDVLLVFELFELFVSLFMFSSGVLKVPHAPRTLCIIPLFTKIQYGLPVARSRIVIPLSLGVVVEPTESIAALTLAALTVCAFIVLTYSVVTVRTSAITLLKWKIPFSIATPRDENQFVTMFVTVVVETACVDEARLFISRFSS